jgi:adenine-specific DNA-methyltransferase
MHTANIVCENILKIKELFPNCIKEFKDSNGELKFGIDFEMLKQELSDEIIESDEKYEFNWPGKKNAILISNSPTNKTLRPCKEESVNWDTTQNLYLEGDNLEILKILRSTYLNKIKIIYIDPPYNTGDGDSIYKDDFKNSLSEYLLQTGKIDEEGNRLETVDKEKNGRFHSDWCSMMYSRLRLARDLLSDDGVIFISIDDNEQTNLEKICDEVFGKECFVSCIVNQTANSVFGPKAAHKFKTFIKVKEYVLVYKKGQEFKINPLYIPSKDYIYGDHDFILKDGKRCSTKEWFKKKYSNVFAKYDLKINKLNILKIMHFDEKFRNEIMEILAESQFATSIYSKNDLDDDELKRLNNGEIITHNGLKILQERNGKGLIRFARPLKESCQKINGKCVKVDILGDVWNTSAGYGNINAEGNIKFPNGKKPLVLIKQILSSLTGNDYTVLDFFSGSSTTAHAVMQLNAEDGGNRKFIMVQLPETCNEKSEAFKAGYKNICEIGKERIRRAGKKIIEETGKTDLDIGFRVFKLDSSNMEDTYYLPQEYNLSLIKNKKLYENIKKDRTQEDLLFQVMLQKDFPLSAQIKEEIIDDKRVFSVDGNNLICCFEDNLTEDLITKIISQKLPRIFVTRNNSIDDNVLTNISPIIQVYSPETELEVI